MRVYVAFDFFNEEIVGVFTSSIKATRYIKTREIDDQVNVKSFEVDPPIPPNVGVPT